MTLKLYGLAACLLLALSCNNSPSPESSTAQTAPKETAGIRKPANIPYEVMETYPHDHRAFTQGLEFHDGYLYESTGQYGISDLRKTDPSTGKILQQVKLDRQYFAEGLTILNGKIYLLTWRERTGLVYDLSSMKLLETFSINTNEAWGLTSDGTHLIYSDGTSNLYFLNPETFREVRTLQVRDQYGPVNYVNEMEFINGYIYANQWQKDHILKIDPATGHVTGKADLRPLRNKLNLPDAEYARAGEPEVLNGIAYDSKDNRIFITGKNWPHMIVVRLDN